METYLGLSDSVRQQIAQNLSLLLADSYVLYTKTQNFHWNVSDSRFYFLHIFLKKEYKKLEEAISEIAERIRELGKLVPGSLKQFLDMTSFKEFHENLSADEMIQELLKNHESICCFLRERIDLVSKLGDEKTANLLIQRLRAHEKSAWLLRSQLPSFF